MKLYRLLLHWYPASFRAEYGDQMCSVFARRLRGVTNPVLTVWFWLETFFDVLYNAALVHLDILRQDLRYTARTLARSRGFTFTAILVAAIGIGASTAAFTMVDHVLIRPFPFADQDRLIMIYEDQSYGSGRRGLYSDVAPGNYRDWKHLSASFDGMAMYHGASVNLITDKDPQQIIAAGVSYDMFPLLGAKPALGRAFSAEDDSDTAPGTVVLSYGLWQGMFGGDAGVLGRKVKVDNAPFTIVGVMPKNFYFPSRYAQLWTPMRFGPQNYEDRTDTWVYVIGRLKRGVSLQTAQTEMSAIAGRLQRAYPKELAHVGVSFLNLRDDGISGQTRLMLTALLGAALCVLLIACTNIANLLIARSMVRRRELAVRTAMGAGRERLVRQMLTESVILAILGGSLGVLLARSSLPLLVRLVPVTLPIAEAPAMDLRVALFAFLITCATGIGFGVIPALRVRRGEDSNGLRQSARSGGGRRDKLRSALVIAEVAGTVVLLVCCGLLIRAMWRVQAVDPGFRTDNILTLRTSLPMPKYEKNAAREQFYQRVLTGARQLPGVQDAAYISFLPMVMGGGIWPVEIKGKPQELTARQLASLRFVTPGFFSIMNIPLLMGRDVSEADTRQAPFVALVSESFVRKYWPGENPMGRHFDFGNYDRVVAGVVGDVRVRGLERSSEPQVYLPYQQHDKVSNGYAPKDLAVRVSENPQALAASLRRIIREADPEQPVSDIRMLSDIVEAETAPRKAQVSVLGAFAVSAFLLAAIGIHGLLAFAVSTRTREIGVRMALGAKSGDIVAMVLRDGLLLATIGIGIGVALAYAASMKLQGILAGVRPSDPVTFLSAAGLCVFMTLVGSLAPALRAVRVDPSIAMRSE
jgi:predicted permease